MKPCPTKTLHSSDESLRGLPLFYAVQLLGIFSFQSGIMEMNWKLASLVLSSQLSPFHSTVNCTNCWGRQLRQLAYFLFFPSWQLQASWLAGGHRHTMVPRGQLHWQLFGNRHPDGWSLPCLQKSGSSWCVKTKAPDAIFMSVYESWDSSLELVRAGWCCWMLTMRWCTALALSEIYG